MKKNMLLVGILAVSLAFAGCGKKEDTKNTEVAKEVAESTAAEEATVAMGNGEEVSEAYFEGEVTDLTKDKITVTDFDGNAKSFVFGETEILDDESPLMHGCYAEIAYPEEDTSAEPKAVRVTVLMSNEEQAASNNVDPYVYGVVKFADQNDLIIDDINGVERVFDNAISRSVSFSGISNGTEVAVTYIGTLDKEGQVNNEDGSGAGAPIAVKIVAADAVTSEDAKKDVISGVVGSVEEGKIVLDTLPMSFEFTGDPAVFAGLEGEENVTVTYEGSLGNLSAVAKSVAVN